MKRALKPSNPSNLLPELAKNSSLLILRLRSLGDVVMLTPALAALHATRPDLRLTVAVEPELAPVLEGNPAVEEILLVREFLEAVHEIRRRRFPVVFNQHGGPTSAYLTALSGAPVRVCWKHCRYGFVYNVRVPDAEYFFGPRKPHTVEHRMTQFYWTGLERGPIPPARVYPHPRALANVERKLKERGLAAEWPYAVMHPGAAYFTKRWAAEKFAEIARWLRETRGIVPVIRLGPGERDIAQELRQALSPQGVVFEPEALDLREVIALISRARLFIGNDSGPAHLAAATARRSVVIFGSSDSVTWRPWQSEHRVVQNDFPCNPCKGDRCYAFDEPRCILSVTVEQVRDACAALLDAAPVTTAAVFPAARPESQKDS
jgi:ADP-heptose:LPS heptosyltransferase